MANWNPKFATGTVKGAKEEPIHEDLRVGIVQRLIEIVTTIPVILNTPVVIKQLLTSGWYLAFHSNISDLIPQYLNHTDNGGDWTGKLTFKQWTESDIITAIGDEERYPVPTAGHLLDKWIIQQYKIINLLRWTLLNHPPFRRFYIGRYDKFYVSDISWSDCETKFNAKAWDFTPISPSPANPAIVYKSNYNVSLLEWRKEAVKIESSIYWVDPTDKPEFSVDIYILSSNSFGAGSTPIEFTPVDGSTVWENLGKIASFPEAIEHLNIIRFLDSDMSSLPNPELSINKVLNNLDTDAGARAAHVVAKFDGPNGFTYKDW